MRNTEYSRHKEETIQLCSNGLMWTGTLCVFHWLYFMKGGHEFGVHHLHTKVKLNWLQMDQLLMFQEVTGVIIVIYTSSPSLV